MVKNQPQPASNPQDIQKQRPNGPIASTQSVKTPQGGKDGQGGGNPPPTNRQNSK